MKTGVANPLLIMTWRMMGSHSSGSVTVSARPAHQPSGSHTSTSGCASRLRYQSDRRPKPAMQYASPSIRA